MSASKEILIAAGIDYTADRCVAVEQRNDQLSAELINLRLMYHELLYAVGRKYPGERRHDTALRYIREREVLHESAAQKITMMHQSKCSMDTPYWANNEQRRRATDA